MDSKDTIVDKPVQTVKINTSPIVILTTIVVVVGLAPVTLFVNLPQLLLYFATVSALASYFSLRNFKTLATEPPSFPEFLLGGLSALYLPAVLGVLWLLLYGIIYWATRLMEALIDWAGPQVQLNADSIAFYPTLAVVIVLGPMFTYLDANNLATELYPNTAGIRSVFYDRLSQERPRLMLYIVVPLVVLAVGLAAFAFIYDITPGSISFCRRICSSLAFR